MIMTRISFDELSSVFNSILLKHGFLEQDAKLCADIFTENTFCGVASHGVNRFHVIIKMVELGLIKPDAKPTLSNAFNGLEVWDGNYGAGVLNAWQMTDRAMELASNFGIGCVALRNTNHWMRAGAYGWKAAENGFAFICWTNSMPNLPPWGSKEARTGNNPIVFAVPNSPNHVVIDTALSQYSYGKLSTHKRAKKPLPFVGGYDSNGELTTDAAEIYSTFRALPIGLWKGAGLSLLLDLIAAALSGGQTTKDISKTEYETGLSQIFIAIDMKRNLGSTDMMKMIDDTIEYYKSGEVVNENEPVLYPGERVFKVREENMRNGVEVEKEIWERILKL